MGNRFNGGVQTSQPTLVQCWEGTSVPSTLVILTVSPDPFAGAVFEGLGHGTPLWGLPKIKRCPGEIQHSANTVEYIPWAKGDWSPRWITVNACTSPLFWGWDGSMLSLVMMMATLAGPISSPPLGSSILGPQSPMLAQNDGEKRG